MDPSWHAIESDLCTLGKTACWNGNRDQQAARLHAADLLLMNVGLQLSEEISTSLKTLTVYLFISAFFPPFSAIHNNLPGRVQY